MRAAQWTGSRETTPVIPFLNPDPVAHLVGQSSEAPVIIDGQKVTALIDLGAHISSISSAFCDILALEVHPLGRLLELEGTGSFTIAYLGYIEVNLQVPGIKGYNEDVLLLVILTTTYSEKVPVMVGSKIIDWVMGMMTKGELARATATWKLAHFSVVMSWSPQCCHPVQLQRKPEEWGRRSLPPQTLILQHPMGFCLDDDQGSVCTTWKVTIPPFGTVTIHGNTGVQGYCMQVHVLAEPAWGPLLPASVVPTGTYGELHPGSFEVLICLRNLSAHPIEVPAKVIVGKVTPANQVPLVVFLMEASRGSTHGPQKGWILETLNLQGLEDWP